MRKWLKVSSLFLALFMFATAPVWGSWIGDLQNAGVDATSKTWTWNSDYNLKLKSGYVDLNEMSAPASPAANFGRLYVKDVGGITSLFFKTYAGTDTNLLTAGSGGTLDQAYDQGGAGAGKAVTVDSGAIALTNNAANNTGLLTIEKTPVGAQSGDLFTITAGANASGDAIQFANSGTGKDLNGSGGTWSISPAGAIVGSSLNLGSGGLGLTGAFSSTGTNTLGNGTGTVAINSSSWDINTTGAASGFSSISMSDDITVANGKGIKGSTTNAETVNFMAYDVDNTTYRSVIQATNGNTIALAIGTNNETVAINSSDWDIGTTGDMTGIGAITMDGLLTIGNANVTLYANEAISLNHATNGAADDLTIALTGATDSSIIVSSTGTGADAISLQASAGGIDIDAAVAQDVNIAGGQVALVSKDDAASAISLTTNVGVSETIVLTNTAGTGESAITLLATAGGVNIDAAATKDLDLAGGQVKLVSKDNAAGAISLTANIGANETITVTNTQGTDEAAINLTSTAGGVNIDAAVAKNISIDGGQVLIGSKDDAASAIALTTNVGVSETIVATNTQGTGVGAITLTATAGGITANVADTKAITLNGTVNYKVGANIATWWRRTCTYGWNLLSDNRNEQYYQHCCGKFYRRTSGDPTLCGCAYLHGWQ